MVQRLQGARIVKSNLGVNDFSWEVNRFWAINIYHVFFFFLSKQKQQRKWAREPPFEIKRNQCIYEHSPGDIDKCNTEYRRRLWQIESEKLCG